MTKNTFPQKLNLRFESSANSDSIQTVDLISTRKTWFESSANSDSIQT